MEISARGLRMICMDEVYVGHLYHGAADRAGVWTVGYGHVASAYELASGKFASGLTEPEALALCREDIAPREAEVLRVITKVKLTQNQFDALVSFEFNTGGLWGSALARKLNAGDFVGAAAEFVRWDHVDGKEVAGLKDRRLREAALFLVDVTQTPSLADTLDIAAAQQFDLSDLVDVTSPINPRDRETPRDPRPDLPTRPDLATLPRRKEDA